MMNIEKLSIGTTPEGKEVHKYTLKNHQGMEVDIINYGAIITAIRIPDRNNEPGDVVLAKGSRVMRMEQVVQSLAEHTIARVA